jgi:glycolate oxidase
VSHAANVQDAELRDPASGVTDQKDTSGRIIDELARVLPPEALITDPAAMAPYRQDRAFDPDAGMPMAVVLPLTTEHVK